MYLIECPDGDYYQLDNDVYHQLLKKCKEKNIDLKEKGYEVLPLDDAPMFHIPVNISEDLFGENA